MRDVLINIHLSFYYSVYSNVCNVIMSNTMGTFHILISFSEGLHSWVLCNNRHILEFLLSKYGSSFSTPLRFEWYMLCIYFFYILMVKGWGYRSGIVYYNAWFIPSSDFIKIFCKEAFSLVRAELLPMQECSRSYIMLSNLSRPSRLHFLSGTLNFTVYFSTCIDLECHEN